MEELGKKKEPTDYRAYYSNGSAAVRPQEVPQYVEPQRVKKPQKQQQQKKNVLHSIWQHFQDMPVFNKIEIIGCVAIVVAVMMVLVVQQIMVASITAENNAVIRSINNYERENSKIAEQVDKDIDADRLEAVIIENGLVPYNDNSN